MPFESRPAHKVNPETAGLMIDNQGDVLDCMGRYTSEEIEERFGGKRAVQSLVTPHHSNSGQQTKSTKVMATINLA